MEGDLSIGIDFGTTFSAIYVFEDDRPEPREYNCKSKFIPTKISYYYNKEDSKDCWYYGYEAERDANRTMVIDVKRMIGMSADLPNLNDLIKEWEKLGIIIRPSYKENCFPKGKIEIQFKRNDYDVFYMSPEELAGNFIKYLVQDIAGITINQNQNVVITIPANYSSNQRKATLDAAGLAGFNKNNIKLLHEPSAAALCFMMQNKRKQFEFDNFLVCDFGGGTFDLSLLKIANAVFDVKRIGGNRYLGGRDFDHIIYSWACDMYKNNGITIDEKYSKQNMAICQLVKEELTINDSTEIKFEGTNKSFVMRQQDFEDQCKLPINTKRGEQPSLLDQVEISINELLKEEKITKDQIDGVILVGGSSKIPIYHSRMKQIFGNKILPFTKEREAIAMGACYLAAFNNGEIELKMKNANFNQRLAHTVGIELIKKKFDPVILKNTIIPCDEHTTYIQTAFDNQKTVCFPIYECDEEYTHNGELISQFDFSDLPPRPKGEIKFKVLMKIDQNGVLKVSCTCTNLHKTINHEHDMEFKKIENFKNILNDDFNNQQSAPKVVEDCQRNQNARNEAKDIILY